MPENEGTESQDLCLKIIIIRQVLKGAKCLSDPMAVQKGLGPGKVPAIPNKVHRETSIQDSFQSNSKVSSLQFIPASNYIAAF